MRLASEAEPLDQPRGLSGALGVVGLWSVAFFGDPGGDETEQGRAFRHGRLDDRGPALERRRCELVRAVGAHARVRVAQLVAPGADLAQQPASRGDQLRALLHDLAVELDLVER